MNRITDKNLESAVKVLNNATGNKVEPVNDRKWNAGTYYIDKAYGGNKLVQVVNEDGGIRDTLGMGYTTKRECFDLIKAYTSGIRDAIDNNL